MSDEKFKVLVVEDNHFDQVLLVSIFEKAGCEVLKVGSVPDAMRLLDDHTDIDVVTLDGNLLGGHGREVANHIVNVLWPKQVVAARGKTAFVVISGSPYKPDGVSAVYGKSSGTARLITDFDGGVCGWLRQMKSHVSA